MKPPLVAGIEAGGTKFVCGVGRNPGEVLRSHRVATTRPAETLAEVIDFLKDAEAEFGPLQALGVASFGPLDLEASSPTYGSLTTTPKPGWAGFDLRGTLAAALGRPVAIDTDVAGAGLAEARLGAGRGLASLAYVTVGTGIGGALIVDGRPMKGLGHAEMGHIPVQRHPGDAAFAGICPFHGDCLEGLASGPSARARHGVPLEQLGQSAPVWPVLADYVAQLCLCVAMIGAPQRIVLGGGVMANPVHLPLVREALHRRNNGYLAHLSGREVLETYLVAPALGDHAGLIGAMMLAETVGV